MTITPQVLITGASGFVGSHITQRFVEAGYRVRCGVRSSSSARWLEHLELEWHVIDFADSRTLRASLRDVDIVVHAAGVTRARDARSYHTMNTQGTVRLAEAAHCEGVRRFVFVSSLAARGPDSSATEAHGHDHPVNHYGESKLHAEKRLREVNKGLEVVVLRPPAVYGPRDKDILPMFKMARAGILPTPLGAGLLQFIFVTDLADATLAAATASVGFGPFAVAEATKYSWSEVSRMMARAYDRTVRTVRLPPSVFIGAGWLAEGIAKFRGALPKYDIRRSRDLAIYSWTCDPEPAADAMGWRAQVELPEGIARTAAWYREQGWL